MPDTTHEVRQNAQQVVHRTTSLNYPVTAVCGQVISRRASNARVWQGAVQREITECPTCFAPPVPDPVRPIEPGDMVTLTAAHGLPSNPRGWTPEQVYVYVGPAQHYTNRAIVLVENGWKVADNLDRMPVGSEAAGLDTPRMEAWSVQTEGMAHAPADYDVDDLPPRIRRARNRLIALRPAVPDSPSLEHPVLLCEQSDASGHPDYPHTHTNGTSAPLWGNPEQENIVGREIHPDGSYVLYAKGTHAPTTTERETPVPRIAHPHPVGTDIYPLSYEKMSTLPPGSVLTVRSRPRGNMAGGYLQFGCQSWPMERLAQAQATVEFTTAGVVVTSDITTNTNFEQVTAAGNRIDLGEFNNYAASVIVKEIAEVPVLNALVMEHGFYGCAVHPGEVLFVGNGHPSNGQNAAPMVGKVNPIDETQRRLTGTVFQQTGLRYHTFADCTPIVSATTAATMHMTRRRSWSLVPATDEQIARVQALPRHRCPVAATTSQHVVACNSEGVPSEAPAMADASPF